MSHFIEGVELASYQIFSQKPRRQIVAPKFRHKFEGIKPMRGIRNKYLEDLVISNLCKKLNDKQFADLEKQNVQFIEHQLAKMKSKLRKQINGSRSVINVFQGDHHDSKLNLKEIIAKMPQRLDLGRKYNTRMVLNSEVARQAQTIYHNRKSMNQWINRQRNSPLKSPNYQHMNFVFQKLKNNRKQLSPLKMKPCVIENIFMKKKNKDYQPLNRRVKTLENQVIFRMSK